MNIKGESLSDYLLFKKPFINIFAVIKIGIDPHMYLCLNELMHPLLDAEKRTSEYGAWIV